MGIYVAASGQLPKIPADWAGWAVVIIVLLLLLLARWLLKPLRIL